MSDIGLRGRIRIGFGRSSITPPVGTWLVGYFDREEESTSVPEELYATALAVEGSNSTLVIVSCDLLAIHPSLVSSVRNRVRSTAKSNGVSVWLCATHTHSGPPSYPLTGLNCREREYVDALPDLIARAVSAAIDDLKPGAFVFGRATTTVGVNRRRITNGQAVMLPAEDRPVDDRLSVLACSGDGHRLRGLVTVLGCHPVTVGRKNCFVSADYPGRLRVLLEQQMCESSIFLIGSAGDVNPRYGPSEDLVSAELVATALLRVSRSAIAAAVELDVPDVILATSKIQLRISDRVEDPQVSGTAMAEHLGDLGTLNKHDTDIYLDRRHPWSHPDSRDYRSMETIGVEVSVARLGELAVVGLPVEVFTEVGAKIEELSPARLTLVLGLTNGAAGYLAPEHEYAFGGYEICGAPNFYRTRAALDPGAAEVIVQEVTRLLTSIWSEEVRAS